MAKHHHTPVERKRIAKIGSQVARLKEEHKRLIGEYAGKKSHKKGR